MNKVDRLLRQSMERFPLAGWGRAADKQRGHVTKKVATSRLITGPRLQVRSTPLEQVLKVAGSCTGAKS